MEHIKNSELDTSFASALPISKILWVVLLKNGISAYTLHTDENTVKFIVDDFDKMTKLIDRDNIFNFGEVYFFINRNGEEFQARFSTCVEWFG